MGLGEISLPKGTGHPHLDQTSAAEVTRIRHSDSPKYLFEDVIKVWKRAFVVKIYQPIVADNLINLLLGFLEYLWVEQHAQHEAR